MPTVYDQNFIFKTMIKAYIHYRFHDIIHKPFNRIPYVLVTTRNQYAARSQYAASLEGHCQFVKIHPVTHTPLHIHGLLIDE